MIADPLLFLKRFWPRVNLYREQREILYSVYHNDETIVVAGNQLGKDYVAGYIALWYFLCNREVRIVTTSVKDDHLRVLWGEIGRFVTTCAVPPRPGQGRPPDPEPPGRTEVEPHDPSYFTRLRGGVQDILP